MAPSAARGLEGLANLRGPVLPVISLRRGVPFPMALADDAKATRVVVLEQRLARSAWSVDRMAKSSTVDRAARSRPLASIQAPSTDLLTGMIKAEDGRSMVMILDTGGVLRGEFKDIAGAARARRAARGRSGTREAGRGGDHRRGPAGQFEVAGQEYAFPIGQVQEIVQLPDRIIAHPAGRRSRHWRDHPAQPAAAAGQPARDVRSAGCGTDGSQQGGGRCSGPTMSVGVVMDSVKEVLRVGRSVGRADAVAARRERHPRGRQAICRLQDGQRLVPSCPRNKCSRRGLRAAKAAKDESGRDGGDG